MSYIQLENPGRLIPKPKHRNWIIRKKLEEVTPKSLESRHRIRGIMPGSIPPAKESGAILKIPGPKSLRLIAQISKRLIWAPITKLRFQEERLSKFSQINIQTMPPRKEATTPSPVSKKLEIPTTSNSYFQRGIKSSLTTESLLQGHLVEKTAGMATTSFPQEKALTRN